jgi:hypothetical protein
VLKKKTLFASLLAMILAVVVVASAAASSLSQTVVPPTPTDTPASTGTVVTTDTPASTGTVVTTGTPGTPAATATVVVCTPTSSGTPTGGTPTAGGGQGQPVAEALCKAFGIDYSTIMGWHDSGVGFGEIALSCFIAQSLGNTTCADVVAAKQGNDFSAYGVNNWGQLIKLALHNNHQGHNLGAVMGQGKGHGGSMHDRNNNHGNNGGGG